MRVVWCIASALTRAEMAVRTSIAQGFLADPKVQVSRFAIRSPATSIRPLVISFSTRFTVRNSALELDEVNVII